MQSAWEGGLDQGPACGDWEPFGFGNDLCEG